MNQVINNFKKVLANISNTQIKTKRQSDNIKLVCVTKTFNRVDIEPVLLTGHRIFGENRVQEAYDKWVDLKKDYEDIELHLIGPLQTNKIKEAVALFDVIETLDRPKLAEKLAEEIKKTNKKIDLMVQINTGYETQKAGILPNEANDFIKLCQKTYQLEIKGLMCIPPVDDEPSPHFALLANIAKSNNLKFLSMGMSSDYETAIMQGANYVRVGSAIFGTR